MSNIKSIEMATTISTYHNIAIKKSLFSTKAFYTPTGSPIRVLKLEYSPSEGERLERLLGMTTDKIEAEIIQNGKPSTSINGNFRIEVCVSENQKFCAFQLFRFSDFNYHPVFEPRIYEGENAKYYTKLF